MQSYPSVQIYRCTWREALDDEKTKINIDKPRFMLDKWRALRYNGKCRITTSISDRGRSKKMAVSYKKLWKILIEKDLRQKKDAEKIRFIESKLL